MQKAFIFFHSSHNVFFYENTVLKLSVNANDFSFHLQTESYYSMGTDISFFKKIFVIIMDHLNLIQ